MYMYYSTAVTFPLDITKTRLQIQGQRGELAKQSKIVTEIRGTRAHRGMLRTLFGISMLYMYMYVACLHIMHK